MFFGRECTTMHIVFRKKLILRFSDNVPQHNNLEDKEIKRKKDENKETISNIKYALKTGIFS
jgi:hypothetical protein